MLMLMAFWVYSARAEGVAPPEWQPSIHSMGPGEQNYLTILVEPSNRYLNWESPRKLLLSYLDAELDKLFTPDKIEKFSMGHAIVGVHCQAGSGEKFQYWAGITGQNDRAVDMENIFKRQIGIGVMFESYDDGTIETNDRILELIGRYHGRDGMPPMYLRFPITPEQCEELNSFYQSFSRLSLGEAKPRKELSRMLPKDKLYYGFLMNPYEQFEDIKNGLTVPDDYKYGGGCTSFMAGFTKLAGVYDQTFESTWMRSLDYTYHLFGGLDPDTGKVRKVPVHKLFSRSARSWVKPGMPVHNLRFYDPELIWTSIREIYDCVASRGKNCSESAVTELVKHGGASHKVWEFPVRVHRRNLDGSRDPFRTYLKTLHVPGVVFNR